tara:strand:+ start:4151 stop:4702 length:552 start_codon:yes stop_codon:yes gene_type:complete
MPRSLNPSLITELAKDSFDLCNLISIDVGSGIHLTDYFHDIAYSGDTYDSSDHLISMGSPRESRDLRVNTLNVSLSGVEQTYISVFLQNDFINRRVIIYKAAMDSGSIVGAPMTLFDGRLTRFEIRESNSRSEVVLEVASHWADFEKEAGRLTNNNSQQFFFSNDLGFEYAANTVRDLKWGRK